MTKRRLIDWEAIEREYRAGQLSVVEIGRQHGVSHTAINKRATKDGWKRDLANRVRQEVSARLATEEVAEKVSAETPEVSAARESEAIEVAAARGVEVVRQHRQDIARYSSMTRRLLAELEESTIKNEEIVAEIDETTSDDRKSLRRQNMLRAVALPTRAGIIKDLSGAAKILIELERRAFNLDNDTEKFGISVKIGKEFEGL